MRFYHALDPLTPPVLAGTPRRLNNESLPTTRVDMERSRKRVQQLKKRKKCSFLWILKTTLKT